MHKHELSLSQRGPEEPELPAESGTADTECVCVCVCVCDLEGFQECAAQGSLSQWVNTHSESKHRHTANR